MIIHQSIKDLFKHLPLKDGLNISFHHHYRNGDVVLNAVLNELYTQDLKALNLYPSGIFPVHTSIVEGLKQHRINNITTNYMNGPVSAYLKAHGLPGELIMQTHGGRARAIEEKETVIDIAFIAVSAASKAGDGSGLLGQHPCGALGYAVADAQYARKVVLLTDTLVETIENPEIKGADVDHICLLETAGNTSQIASGTLSVTRDPVGLKIAREAMRVIKASGYFKQDVSFQSGAGSVSLAITQMFVDQLKQDHLTASFFTGGITGVHAQALKDGLVRKLYDVQCFDEAAIESLKNNPNHEPMSASLYASPSNEQRKIKALDIVILGASEIDLDFNVNVTSDSYHTIIGGSGGHQDTAEDAKLSIIVAPLIKARTPLIKHTLTSRTTPGKHIACLITERGIAVNDAHDPTLKTTLEAQGIQTLDIQSLMDKAHALTLVPAPFKRPKHRLGYIEGRRKDVLDTLYWGERDD